MPILTHTRSVLLHALAATAVASIPGTVRAASTYTLTDLGIASGNTSSATAINNAGTVAGYEQVSGNYQAFVSSGGTATVLPTLGGLAGSAYAINSSGQVGGYSRADGTLITHATLWTNGMPADVGVLPGGETKNRYVYAVNDQGLVAGNSYVSTSENDAFKTTSGGTLVDLAGLTSGKTSSARGLNSSGVVSGYSTTSGGTTVPVYWDASGGIHQLPGLGGTAGGAGYAINKAGVMTGYETIAANTYDSFIYDTTSGQLTDLGAVTGYVNSEAVSINASNTVVGTAYSASFASVAFVSVNGQLTDLNTLVSAPGLTLISATGINDSGQIVGQAVDSSGGYHAYMLTLVPEPATLGVIAVAAIGLLRRRRS